MKSSSIWLALLAAILANACGGGGGDTAASAPAAPSTAASSGNPSALAVGTVTGFGSLIVDGKRWDDRNARVERNRDDNPSLADLAEAKLGHRVEIEADVDSVAKTIRIEAEVMGRVSAIDATARELKIAGQTVRTNTDPAAGPVTVYADGYTRFADIALDDVAEVHGAPRFDSGLGRYVIDASRIEKKADLPAGIVRIAGVVTTYDPAARTFKLGELVVNIGNALVVPANRALANGQRVVVWTSAVGAGPTASASFIRIKERSDNTGVASEVAGRITRFDAANATFEVGGIKVNAKSAIILPAQQALANELYVIVRGSFAADGSLNASQIRLRKKELEFQAEAEIRGTITDFVSLADFKLRGVAIDASGASLKSCPTPLADGLFVEVEGRLTGTGVKASSLKCEDGSAAGMMIELRGVASQVDLGAKTFVLNQAGSTRLVRWTDMTYFADLSPATLAGKTVEVEGFVQGSELIARKVKLEH